MRAPSDKTRKGLIEMISLVSEKATLGVRKNIEPLAIMALIAPIAIAIIASFVPHKRYEASALILVDAARGSSAFSALEERRGNNEVVTYDQVLRTQLSIASSEDVVRRAIKSLSPAILYPDIHDSFPVGSELDEREYSAAKNDLSFVVEPNTFIIRISFRHKDASLAAKFVNQLLTDFLARRSTLYGNEGAVDFFSSQESKFSDELHESSLQLEKFSRDNRVYDVREQRKLLLEARSLAQKELDRSANDVARAEGELESLRLQLASLRRNVTLPPEIFGDTISATVRSSRREDPLANDPPLLNVKIYQDSAARLVSMNSELAGLRVMATRRAGELGKINGELDELARSEAQFNNLRSSVTRAESYIESLSKRAGEARVNAAWRSNEAFSSAQILQNANVPIRPVFPKPGLFIAAGLLVGVLLAGTLIYIGKILAAAPQRT